MSVTGIIPQFSSLGMSSKCGDERIGAGLPSPSSSPPVPNALRHVSANARSNGNSAITSGTTSSRRRRQFCSRCNKAGPLCICGHVETVVENKTAVTILQHPLEKAHPLGTARIALLGLRNVEVISIPEMEETDFCRIREKIPGSKRFLAGRGGKKSVKPGAQDKKIEATRIGSQDRGTSDPERQSLKRKPRFVKLDENKNIAFSEEDAILELDMAEEDKDNSCPTGSFDKEIEGGVEQFPPWIKLQSNAGLLFPSQHAVDLSAVGPHVGKANFDKAQSTLQTETGGRGRSTTSPSQLIIIDGTWSKARRIYHENPWLSLLPHYRLPTIQDSRYGGLRREPKPGFVSTIESIVYALQLLEPETQGLESLLDVFDNMMEQQLKYMQIQQRERNLKLESACHPPEISPGVEADRTAQIRI